MKRIQSSIASMRIQSSLATAETDNAVATSAQKLLAARVEALLAKMGIEDIPIVIEESSDTSSEKDEDLPLPKMDLPSFDGTYVQEWLARAEEYFLVHETPVAKKLKLIMIVMSRPVMSWFQLLPLAVP